MIPTGQEDPGNPPMVQAYGCDLFSHWSYVENCWGRTYFDTPEIVTLEYNRLLSNGMKDIGADCTIEDGEALFAFYGIKAQAMRTGPATNPTWIDPSYQPTVGQIIILCYHWDEKGFIHFAPGTLDKQVLWDPIARGSNTIKNGYLHSLRIYDMI